MPGVCNSKHSLNSRFAGTPGIWLLRDSAVQVHVTGNTGGSLLLVLFYAQHDTCHHV